MISNDNTLKTLWSLRSSPMQTTLNSFAWSTTIMDNKITTLSRHCGGTAIDLFLFLPVVLAGVLVLLLSNFADSSSSIRFCSLLRASIVFRKREFSSITLWRRRARLSSILLRQLHSSPVWNNALKGRDDRKWKYADRAIPKTWAATCTFPPMNAHFLLAYFCMKETRLPTDWSGTQYLFRPVSRPKHVW